MSIKYKNALVIVILGYIIYILLQHKEVVKKSENGYHSDWSDWSSCNKECGGGIQSRTRTYTSAINGGIELENKDDIEETKNCNEHECSINGYHSNWSDWTSCNKECGGGVQSRTRVYTHAKFGGVDLSEDERNKILENQICNTQVCPENGYHSNWSGWTTCNKNCGGGVQSRTRVYTPAKFGGIDLSLDERNKISEEQVCNTISCPVNGYHSNWSNWLVCNKECGGGIQSRTRVYTPAKFGGIDLSLDERNKISEEQVCNTQVCPENGYHSDWSDWSACNKPCGNGTQRRTRTYTPAKFGGLELEDKNILVNIQLCNTQECPTVVNHSIFLKNEERAENSNSYSILSPNGKYMLRWNAGLWFIIDNKLEDGSWYPSATLSVSSQKTCKSVVVSKYNISLIGTDWTSKVVASSDKPCLYSALTDNGDWIFVREDKTTVDILKNNQNINLTW
jgi:hypothetical protein